jgi:ATP-grasp domain
VLPNACGERVPIAEPAIVRGASIAFVCMRVLLTGARAPASLELARLCARAGHEVHVADTGRWHICRGSRLLAGCHRLPAPRAGHARYAAALASLGARLRLDVVVPTCEEVFHLAAIAPQITAFRIACEPLDRLGALHDKWRFIALCVAAGLPVPRTRLLSVADVRGVEGDGRWILKPRYSRFATRVHVVSGGAALPDLGGDAPSAWVAQEYLDGAPLCTWSVVSRGRLQAHVTYAVDATAGVRGAAIAFHSVRHDAVRAWVERFVSAHALTGQFAFDFVDGVAGLRAIECNPRLTSGVHCFRDIPAVTECVLREQGDHAHAPLEPPPGLHFRSRLALAVYRSPSHRGAGLLDATDDPWPRRLQLLAWGELLARAAVARRDPRQVSTSDIEWNGERNGEWNGEWNGE